MRRNPRGGTAPAPHRAPPTSSHIAIARPPTLASVSRETPTYRGHRPPARGHGQSAGHLAASCSPTHVVRLRPSDRAALALPRHPVRRHPHQQPLNAAKPAKPASRVCLIVPPRSPPPFVRQIRCHEGDISLASPRLPLPRPPASSLASTVSMARERATRRPARSLTRQGPDIDSKASPAKALVDHHAQLPPSHAATAHHARTHSYRPTPSLSLSACLSCLFVPCVHASAVGLLPVSMCPRPAS